MMNGMAKTSGGKAKKPGAVTMKATAAAKPKPKAKPTRILG